jgi:hypothetical protein
VAKPRPEKKRDENQPAEQRVLPMELQAGDRLADEIGEYEVIGRAVYDERRQGRSRARQASR